MADTDPKAPSAKKRSGTTASKPRGTTGRSRPKSASTRGSKSATARSGTGASRTTSRSSAAKKPASPNGRTKSTSAKSSSSRAKSRPDGAKRSAVARRSPAPARPDSNGNGHGVVGSAKQVAHKAKVPAIAIGAAAAGMAGGIALGSRARPRTVLGVSLPKHRPSVDAKSLAKSVGKVGANFVKTSKTVSKERAGDQAKRIGRIRK